MNARTEANDPAIRARAINSPRVQKFLDDANAAAGRTVAVQFPVGYSSRGFDAVYDVAAEQIGHRPQMNVQRDRAGYLVAMTTPGDRETVAQIIATVSASA